MKGSSGVAESFDRGSGAVLPSKAGPTAVTVAVSSLRLGGTQRFCVELCNTAVTEGESIRLLVADGGGVLRDQVDPRVEVKDLRKPRIRNCFAELRRQLVATPASPVLACAADFATMVLLAKVTVRMPNRIVFREGSLPLANVRWQWRWIYPLLLARADHVVAQSRVAKEQLIQLGVVGRKIEIINNPCRFPARRSRPEPYRSKGAHWLAVGRLSSEKGFDLVLRAFAEYRSRFPDARLTILGEGPERLRLEQLVRELKVADAVALPGFVAEVTEWYARADVYVMASKYEGQSNSLFEALVAGCPVVCLDGLGGTGELLRDLNLESCLVPNKSAASLFSVYVERVTQAPLAVWQHTAERIREMTNPAAVWRQYNRLVVGA